MDDDGNGGAGRGHTTILGECKQMFTSIQSNQERTNLALWGSEGTTGMVKDINEIKQQSRIEIYIGGVIIGIIASVTTTGLILFIFGKL